MYKFFPVLCILILLLVACESGPTQHNFSGLPLGNAANGETLFNNGDSGAPACSTCHQVDDSQGNLAPSLGGYAERAGTRVNGQSAAEYTFTSIVQPSKYVVTGYSNVMYTGYDKELTAQQIADLIAYLLEL